MPVGFSPRLSIIATSRNDDHGGGMISRMQMFVDCLVDQCSRRHLDAELILVEWNPPENRPRLRDALRWPKETGTTIRILEVPASIHNRFQHSDRLPLFQMIAKNAGIRRARANTILSTNVDILFSEELIAFLKSSSFNANVLYRIDRYDVPSDIPDDFTVVQKLEYCRKHLLRIHTAEGSLNIPTGEFIRMYSPLHHMPHALAILMERCFPKAIKNQHWYREHLRLYTKRRKLHTNGSGDFMLMAKENWFKLRGYSEFEGYSFHLDSLLCYAAFSAGVKEKILRDPMRIYHIEHEGGWTPEKAEVLDTRLKRAGVPSVSDAQLDAWAVEMQRQRKPLVFNGENWGLADYDLPETVISKRPANAAS